jgi:hypothetical protein
MTQPYDKRLFHEFLVYPNPKDLKFFPDRNRKDKIDLIVMDWFDEYGDEFMTKEYKLITKNFWKGAKEQAKENFDRLLRV